MAVVEYRRSKDLGGSVNYVQNERDEDSVISAKGCSVETAIEDFRNVKKSFEKTGDTQTLCLVQSWHPNEAKLKTVEEFHEMGRQLANECFSGHQYVIRTHTDKGHIHNHIALNTVNMENGKFLKNSYFMLGNDERWLTKVRSASDRICLENGLSVLNKDALERRANLPKDVKRMERAKKPSWKMDLIQKAHFAKSISTDYDEYREHLKSFDIEVSVEDKNIRYRYPGEKRPIRGKTLTPDQRFNKSKLEEAFRENDLMFHSDPKLKSYRMEQTATLRAQKGKTVRDVDGKPIIPDVRPGQSDKDYGEFTKVPRREHEKWYRSDKKLEASMVPIEEIRRARNSIPEYCKKNKIELIKNDKGETVLKGREHVHVKEFEVFNKRNGTPGSLIDFVAAHHNLTLLQSVAKITNNPRILLLEQSVGKKNREFTSFYIPKQNGNSEHTEKPKGPKAHGEEWFEDVLRSSKCRDSHGRPLRENDSDQVSKKFREFTKTWMGGNDNSQTLRPLFTSNTKGRHATLFLHPKSLVEHHGDEMFNLGRKLDGLLGLTEPSAPLVDQFIARNKSVTKLSVIGATPGKLTPVELDLFENLKKRYKPLNIEVEHHTSERAPSLARGPELSL